MGTHNDVVCIILYWSFGNEGQVKYGYQISLDGKKNETIKKLQRYNYLNLGISRLVFAAKIVWIEKENLIAVHYYYLFFYKLDFPESAKK